MRKSWTAQNIYVDMLDRVRRANDALIAAGVLPAGIDQSRIAVEPPRDPTHGDMATNAAMVLAKDAGKKPRDLARSRSRQNFAATPLIANVDVAGPGFINLTLKPAAWIETLRIAVRLGPRYGRSDSRAGHAGQCRICLGQSDRADACRPLPRRRVRRCAGQSARVRRLQGDARILRQRRRRAGRCARALGLSCATARRWARTSGRSRKGFIRATISSRSARRSPRNTARALGQPPESAWLPSVRAKAIEMMMAAVRADLAALGVNHDVFFSERSLVEGEADQVAETIEWLRARGLCL